MTSDTDSLQAEFDASLTRHGICIPAERRDVMLQAFIDFRALLAELHGPLEPTLEPAYIHAAAVPNEGAPDNE